MKAIIRTKAGKELSTMEVQELAAPIPNADEIKVRMVSSRINPVDIDLMKGMPFVKYKKPQIGGIDGAGIVEEIGANVNQFKKGDAIFFYRKFTDIGTWAEEITIKASDAAKIPNNISVEQAGAITLPLLTAYESLQALDAKKGEQILIHGAGGGVGFQAVQLAKVMGLKVVANASQRDFKSLKSIGVEQLIDYKTQAFEQILKIGEVDYVFDVVGKDTLLKSIQLRPKKVVSVNYIDASKMHKTGIQMPAFLKPIMGLAMRKYRKAAKKNGVEIIGQVTGANGKGLTEASRLVEQSDYQVKSYSSVNLNAIEKNGMNDLRIGTIIKFD